MIAMPGLRINLKEIINNSILLKIIKKNNNQKDRKYDVAQ